MSSSSSPETPARPGTPGTPGTPGAAAAAGHSRAAVVVVFFALGAISASWAARIPAIRAPLHLSDQALGVALLGPAAGAVLAMPLTGSLLGRVAPRRVVLVALVPLAALVPLVTAVDALWQLFGVLAVWGACVGVVDVGMNTEAATVQARLGRRVMSGFHASYSAGGLVGAGTGAACASLGVSVRAQLVAVSAAALVAATAAAVRFDPSARPVRRPAAPQGVARVRWSWALVALAAMAFASFLSEGAANDWSAVYLHSSLGTSTGVAALGYAGFAVAMTVGRLVGDRLATRWTPGALVRWSAGAAAVAWGGALVVHAPAAALAGLVLLGFGLSSVVPSVFSRAAGIGRAGPSLAVVTSCGYAGMLGGPTVIGAVAGVVGLSSALGLVALLAVVIAALAGVLAPPTGRQAVDPRGRTT